MSAQTPKAPVDPMSDGRNHDADIARLRDEFERLRATGNAHASETQKLLMGQAETKLVLAQQDKVLSRIAYAIDGNGKPGILTRQDRSDRWIGNISRALWLIGGIVAALVIKMMFVGR